MIEKFLKAKHWQLFGLMIGIPIIIEIILFVFIFSSAVDNTRPPFNILAFFPLIMFVFMGLFFGWFWSIAIGLQPKVPENVKMKVKKFKTLFFIPIIYISFLSLFISGIFTGQAMPGSGGGIAAVILPLHLFSMFCIFYCMYFVSKTIKTVELQRETKFGDFAVEFFLFWFSFVGIWILQPRINQLAKNDQK